MTCTALVTGQLVTEPKQHKCNNGAVCTSVRMSVSARNSDELASVVGFGSMASQLAALNKGDTLSVTGRARPTSWIDQNGVHRAGLRVTADNILTVFHLRTKRLALAGPGAGPGEAGLAADDGGAVLPIGKADSGAALDLK